MTAAAQCQMMTATIVNTAKGIIAAVAAVIARFAKPQYVWDVLIVVHHAMSQSAKNVPPNARIARRHSVKIV